MFGGGGNGAEGRSASACGSTSHELNFDLPNLPWNVWIDGKNLIVRDACNEYVGTFRAESKCLVSDVAKLIEQATRAR
jgi:hypothetical protein